jgi:hypothetical protein
MEHWRMGSIRILPVGFAGNNNPDRRLLRFHRADLHRRCMRAENLALAVSIGRKKERIVHFAGRVALGEIQRGEIVIIGFNIGPFSNGKTHISKNRGDLINHLRNRMNTPGFNR